MSEFRAKFWPVGRPSYSLAYSLKGCVLHLTFLYVKNCIIVFYKMTKTDLRMTRFTYHDIRMFSHRKDTK